MSTQNEIKPATPAEALNGGRCAVDAGFGSSVYAHTGYCQCGAAWTAYDYECPGCGREANPPTNTRGEIGEPS